MESTEPRFIEKKPGKDASSDFEILFQQALTLIQKLTGHVWTDFNIHDPGVTIVEQLCFALTDLYYKTTFDIEDILTSPKGLINREQHAFFEKQQILTCNPVTVNDFRKIILDSINELDNIMLTPILSLHNTTYIKGLYKMQIRVNGAIANRFKNEPELKNDIKERIRSLYLSKRNLCEDVIDHIVILEPQIIRLYANITVNNSASPEQTLVDIYTKIESLLNPKITFHSERELLDRGHPVEEIFCGPLLNNGIILDRELKKIDAYIDLIDLTDSITNLPDVVNIQKIKICDEPQIDDNNPDGHQTMKHKSVDQNGAVFELKEDHFPYLDITTFSKYVTLYSDDYKLPINETLLLELYNRTVQLNVKKRQAQTPKKAEKYIKAGTYKNIGDYYSIQNYFPVAYGIGKNGLSKFDSNERKAAAKQLKVYLIFFEQILANYTAQLANIGNLYATDLTAANRFSYYTQPLYNVPGIQDVLNSYTSPETAASFNGDTYEIEKHWKEFQKDNGYATALKNVIETPEEYLERKNKILDHLLARFNRKLSVYPIQHYFTTYIKGSAIERDTFILKWKAHILENLITIDQGKIRGFNYLSETNEISGFEYKVSLCLNINQINYPKLNQFKKFDKNSMNRRKLSSVFDDGSNTIVGIDAKDGATKQKTKFQTISFNEEEIKIIENSEPLFDPSVTGKLKDFDPSANKAHIFHNQTISLLEFGICKENYRILPSTTHKDEFIIIYKSPLKEEGLSKREQTVMKDKWHLISSHISKEEANEALSHLIKYLTKLSIEAEGFHLVEHLLLRPRLDQPCFGFRFYDGPDSVLFQNESWTTHSERELFLTKLKEAFKNETNMVNIPPLDFQVKHEHTQLFTSVNTAMFKDHSTNSIKQDIKKAIAELNYLGDKNNLRYPCIKFTVKIAETEIVEEDFYSFKATVVLPSWPARFQDKEFKLFTENMFRALAPAHLNLNFKWLGIKRMQDFEHFYFEWLENNKNTNVDARLRGCLPLTKWLKGTVVKKEK